MMFGEEMWTYKRREGQERDNYFMYVNTTANKAVLRGSR